MLSLSFFTDSAMMWLSSICSARNLLVLSPYEGGFSITTVRVATSFCMSSIAWSVSMSIEDKSVSLSITFCLQGNRQDVLFAPTAIRVIALLFTLDKNMKDVVQMHAIADILEALKSSMS
ncbi:hypothetical protein L1987_13525 [Smallanthus sonchifolius]|uniref:Uncharacterized protein n=1 Tax=Smallanthus sonchifolius TaxID=185202 RepID=A0ACB9JJ37_9ASTR|nr:hypothetical protein L1987_13525 [Smallanthus sonchifolius]